MKTLNIVIFAIFLLLIVKTDLIGQSVRVLSPNGGETLNPNERYGITWISEDVEFISIFYKLNDSDEWNLIVNKVSAELGNFSWKVPKTTTKTLQIKIVSDYSELIFDVS
ncbi:MAG: hypothetical protein R3250_13470, partial [Melioribacteraceae bacterium]|nr:hypothetical protein [Melioribacteraceae bacterium]